MVTKEDSEIAASFASLKRWVASASSEDSDLEEFKNMLTECVASLPSASLAFSSRDAMLKKCFADASGINLLHCAAEHGAVDVISYLLDESTDLPNDSYANDADGDGRAPIHWAAWKCQPKAIKELIDNGSRLDAQTKSGFTALHYCAARGGEEAALLGAQHLLDAGADYKVRNGAGQTPAAFAASLGREAFVKLLLRHKEKQQEEKRLEDRGGEKANVLRSDEPNASDITNSELQRAMKEAENERKRINALSSSPSVTENVPNVRQRLVDGFIPSDTFAGDRPGFYFSRGPNGVGYYPDPGALDHGETSAAARNSIDSSLLIAGAVVFLGVSIVAAAVILKRK